MTIARWSPPALSLSAQALPLWNALVSRAGQPLALAAKDAFATFELADPPDVASPCIVVEPDRGPTLYTSWGWFPFSALFGADLAARDLLILQPALRDALAEGMVAFVWDKLPDLGAGAFSIGYIGRLDQFVDDDARHALDWFNVTLSGLGQDRVALAVGCERAGLLDLLRTRLGAARSVHGTLGATLTAEAVHTLGSIRLTLDEMTQLEPGALVVLPAAEPGVALLRLQRIVCVFRPNGAGWQFTGWSEVGYERSRTGRGDIEEAGMQPQAETTGTHAERLPSLPIIVDFDLGSTTLPLAELESWQVGSLVALDPPQRGDSVEVTLRANGQVIGTGDLMQIDDRLVVRIARLTMAPRA